MDSITKLRVAMCPVVTLGVDTTDVRRIFQIFQAKFKDFDSQSSLSAIIFFPRILNPAIKKATKLQSFRRKDRAYYIGIEIDYRNWMMASPNGQRDMVIDNIIHSIASIPAKHLEESTRKTLEDAIQATAVAIRE
jgi:hypothetical protein